MPWSWFLVRDTAVILEWVAILLPILLAIAVTVLLVTALALRAVAAAVLAVSTALAGAVAIVAPWTPAPTGSPEAGLRVLAANVFGNNDQHEAIVADIMAEQADVVVL